jgi:acylphosphatase
MSTLVEWLGFGPKARAYILIKWNVFEGAYHFYAERCARRRRLKGWMRVVKGPLYEYIEMEVEGSKYRIEKMIADLQKGPPNSKATGVDISWKEFSGNHNDFRIRS